MGKIKQFIRDELEKLGFKVYPKLPCEHMVVLCDSFNGSSTLGCVNNRWIANDGIHMVELDEPIVEMIVKQLVSINTKMKTAHFDEKTCEYYIQQGAFKRLMKQANK